AGTKLPTVDAGDAVFGAAEARALSRVDKLLSTKGRRTPASFHKELGKLMWDKCGMSRNAKGLSEALARIPGIREEFWKDVAVSGSGAGFNQTLERAYRVADYLEFAELLVRDALERKESCGGHFREESQTPDNEAKRDDAGFCHVAAWEHAGEGKTPTRHTEPLTFENARLAQRNYA
ncbi:MAG: fumarate reductase/succinate dehydrogenase flavoprotein subunit, partial [Elusimicrobiota bacterium]